jgi:hypothetical protein
MKLLTAIAGAVLLLSCGTIQASIIQFTTVLSGAAEDPPRDTPGTGQSQVIYDPDARTMQLIVSFADLLGPVSAAHIHAPTATPFAGLASPATQVPSLVGFPHGATAGTYDHLFDLTEPSSYNPSFLAANMNVAGAEAALISALAEGRAYLNIHTSVFPGGEIRGFYTPVPDASPTGGLLALALVTMMGCARYRR